VIDSDRKEMFSLGRLSTCLLAFSGKYSFQDERLKGALELCEEAQQLANDGKYRDACDTYMQGIFMGRKSVQRLQENNDDDDDDDDPTEALDWLVSSHAACGEARIRLGDWQTARSDLWAACTYSQNTNLQSLKSMLTVCKNTDDSFGELRTLNSIRDLLSFSQTKDEMSIDELQQRIAALEEELERKSKL
jgi:hypothetical protein